MVESNASKQKSFGPQLFIRIAEVRQHFRKQLWKSGSKKLNLFSPRDFLEASAVEVFGDYSHELPIFRYLVSVQSLKADEIVIQHMGSEWVLSMQEILIDTVDLEEQLLIINHLQVRNIEFRKSRAERFRESVSLFVRNKKMAPPASTLEVQIAEVAICGLLMLLRQRRHKQAREFIKFAVMQTAAVMILENEL